MPNNRAFTDKQVILMRRIRRKSRLPLRQIAAHYGVSVGAVSRAIRANQTYAHLDAVEPPLPKSKPGPRGVKSSLAKLNGEQVRFIREQRADGVPRRELADHFGVAVTTISAITGGKTWKWLPQSIYEETPQ